MDQTLFSRLRKEITLFEPELYFAHPYIPKSISSLLSALNTDRIEIK